MWGHVYNSCLIQSEYSLRWPGEYPLPSRFRREYLSLCLPNNGRPKRPSVAGNTLSRSLGRPLLQSKHSQIFSFNSSFSGGIPGSHHIAAHRTRRAVAARLPLQDDTDSIIPPTQQDAAGESVIVWMRRSLLMHGEGGSQCVATHIISYYML